MPVIENLASHQGTYDTLNLSDNSITVLGNIPEGMSCTQHIHVGARIWMERDFKSGVAAQAV